MWIVEKTSGWFVNQIFQSRIPFSMVIYVGYRNFAPAVFFTSHQPNPFRTVRVRWLLKAAGNGILNLQRLLPEAGSDTNILSVSKLDIFLPRSISFSIIFAHSSARHFFITAYKSLPRYNNFDIFGRHFLNHIKSWSLRKLDRK